MPYPVAEEMDMGEWQPHLRDDVVREIDRFRPTKVRPEVWAVIAPFVREVVATTVPATTYKASVILGQASRITEWCFRRGADIKTEVVFHPDTIDEFIADQCTHLTDGTQLNYRLQLRSIGEIVLGPPLYGPRPVAMRISEPTIPYSDDEIAALFAAARTFRTPRQREGYLCIIALALGAGLGQSEIATTVGHAVRHESGAVLISIKGDRRRETTVKRQFENDVVYFAEAAGNRPMFLPKRESPSSRQVSRFIERLPDNNAPKLSIQRLRATWIVSLLDMRVGLNLISEAAGVRPDQVSVYTRYMASIERRSAIEQLRR